MSEYRIAVDQGFISFAIHVTAASPEEALTILDEALPADAQIAPNPHSKHADRVRICLSLEPACISIKDIEEP